MKILIILSAIFLQSSIFAQSPSLSVNLKMRSSDSGKYKIQMKICKPVKGSPVSDYFNNEISSIDFKILNHGDIKCEEYISNYNGENEFDNFHYANQLFAWEKILIWKITDESSASQKTTMYLILPVKMKSFVTHIKIKDIEFQTDKIIWLDETGEISRSKRQEINLSLKNKKGVAVKESKLKDILD